MRINQPSDELGGMLLLMLPSRVIHHIDAWSPLLPEHLRHPASPSASSAAQAGYSPMNSYRYPQIRLRAMDAMQGNRAVIESDVTGEAFSTQKAYESHHIREKITDIGDGDGGLNPIAPTSHLKGDQLMSALEKHFRENHVEILVIVEGIDPTCSQTLQSCYSYTVNDFCFNTHDYAECVHRQERTEEGGARGGALMVNYHQFQELVPLDDNNESNGTHRSTASAAAAGDLDRAARSV